MHEGKKKSYINSDEDVAGSNTVYIYIHFLNLESGNPNFGLFCIYYSWRVLKCQLMEFSGVLVLFGFGFLCCFFVVNLQSSFEQVLTAADGVTKNPERPDSLCSAFFMLI